MRFIASARDHAMKAKAPSSQKGPSSEGPLLASPAPPRSKPRQGGETPPLTSLLPTQWAQNTHPDHLPSSEQGEASASSYRDSARLEVVMLPNGKKSHQGCRPPSPCHRRYGPEGEPPGRAPSASWSTCPQPAP